MLGLTWEYSFKEFVAYMIIHLNKVILMRLQLLSEEENKTDKGSWEVFTFKEITEDLDQSPCEVSKYFSDTE